MKINDYDLAFSAAHGWAKVETSGKETRFDFKQYDAVSAAIELGFIEQPDDRDEDRIGYEKPLFSATVRQSFDYAKRIKYQFNFEALREFSGTEFAEQIVSHLALQAPEVREVIQAEAERIALHECPASIVDSSDIELWMDLNHGSLTKLLLVYRNLIDYKQISDRKKALWYAAEEETINSL